MAGGRIDIEVAADLARFPAELERGLKGVVGTATKLGGLIGGAIGVSMGAQAVMDLGNSFTNSLNEMQAVSQATAEQMNAVKEAAKGLGNDASIADTSAVDAAQAMTELAKGGFSVDEAMSAARGTLQLAAAAQIDAATAATIQSQALQAFGLDADYAAKAADVLANGANASSAEIVDVAAGLQQAGAVANQFGVSLEDTVAGLGLLANAGIKGSDAGTLLKSALLALTDQGKPAQGAIEDLGLTVYNAAGEFVGFRSLFEQLQEASQNMTPEMYQAATATLFGSDAMRLAGVAAEQGATGWDTMRDAIEREGAAAEVAAAKTQGLPGALAAIENSAEGVMLTIYDLVDGPLEKLANFGAGALEGLGTQLESGFQSATEAVSAFAESDLGQDRMGELTTLVDSVRSAASAAAPAIIQIGTSVATVAGMVTGGGLSVLLDMLNGAADIAGDVLVPALELVGSVLEGNEAAVATFAGGFLAFEGISSVVESIAGPFEEIREKADQAREFIGHFATATRSTTEVAGYGTVQMGRFGTAIQQIGQRVPAIANMQGAFLNAAAGAERFGRMAGVAAAAGEGIKSAAGGVVNALGGPMGVALATASIALAVYGEHQATIAERNRKIAESADELGSALADSNGRITEAAQAAAAAALENNELAGSGRSLLEYLESVGVAGKQAAAGLAGNKEAMEATLAVLEEQAELERQINSERLTGEGFGSTGLGQLLNWGGARDAANEAQNALDTTRQILDATREAEEAARRHREALGQLDGSGTTTALGTMADTMREFADSTGTAAEKVDILKGGLAALRGDEMSMEDATKRINDALRGFGEALTAAGEGALNSTGQIDTTTAAGSRLYDALKSVQSGYDDVISAAYQAELQRTNSEEAAAAAAIAAGNEQREQFIATAVEAGKTRAEAEALANTYGLLPDRLITMVQLNGDKEAEAALKELVEKERIARIQVAVDTYGVGSAQAFAAATNAMSEAAFRQRFPQARAEGGPIEGGIPGKDSVPILAMPGEHMLTVADVEALGGQEGVYRFRAALQAGKVGRFEVGGAVGDDIAVRRAAAFLAGEDGKPYQYAGVGTPSWDCSAYASAAYAMLTGRDPYTRWFTTESDFNSLGFRSGMGGPGDLSIGVYRGGGGEYSHMAGTLAGVPFESSSAGVFFGRNTMGAADPNLPLKWYLPAEAFVPPGDPNTGLTGYSGSRSRRTATWDTEDELKLESARISVRQAQEDLAAALNDPKKSQADRDQAAVKVRQAEEKVRKLEEQKTAAENGGSMIAPAPELTTAYTDEELRLRQLERAVDEARWDRDEVYADPEAGPWDREEADDKLQSALNALAEEQRKQRLAFAPEAPALTTRMTDEQLHIADLEDAVEQARLDRNAVYADPRSTDRDRAKADRDLQKALNALEEAKAGGSGITGSNLAELFGNVAKTAVQGQLEDAFNVIGLTNGGSGALGTAISLGVEEITKQIQRGPTSPPSFSVEELAKQGPVIPGTEDWMQQLIDSLQIPAVLRDAGGPLPHGMAALNLSGGTEWVLTTEDKRRYDRDMEELAALRADRNTSGGGQAGQLGEIARQLRSLVERPPVQHTSQYYGYEQSEAQRRERDRVDQYSRTYLRR